MKRVGQKGFALFEAIVIVGVVAIVALAGWNIYRLNQKDSSSAPASQTVKVVPLAPDITNVGDLDKATQTLDQTQIDTVSDTAQLDKDLASF